MSRAQQSAQSRLDQAQEALEADDSNEIDTDALDEYQHAVVEAQAAGINVFSPFQGEQPLPDTYVIPKWVNAATLEALESNAKARLMDASDYMFPWELDNYQRTKVARIAAGGLDERVERWPADSYRPDHEDARAH